MSRKSLIPWRSLLLGLLMVLVRPSNAVLNVASASANNKNKEKMPTVPDSGSDQDKPSSIPKEAENFISLLPISLTSQNFASTVGDGNVWLIEFYTPWCRHCQNFAPSYNDVAKNFHNSPQEGIRVAKVDCQAEKALRTRFGVKSYPSFYLVDGWSVYEFDGTRSAAALMDFARGGYKKQEPIPTYSSPMGPMGLLQGWLIYLGAIGMNFFEYVQDAYGVSPLLAGVVLSFCAIFGGMVSVVAIAILTTPKDKND